MPTRLWRWQWVTLLMLTIGYAGYYVCRSNLSACTPRIRQELVENGWEAKAAQDRIGDIVSLGVFFYAGGKFLGGWTADRLAGRATFLGAMLLSVMCTLAFAGGRGFALWAPVWVSNRFVQSFGWPGMMRIMTRWYSPAVYGSAVGVVSLSYLFGDAGARWFFGWLFGMGVSWREVFLWSAAVLGGLLALNVLFLRSSPKDVGLPEPNDAFATDDTDAAMSSAPTILELLKRPAFLWACVLSFGFTLSRETFNTWTTTYYRDVVRMTDAEASNASAWFPFYGGVSVILAGILRDRLGRRGEAATLVIGPLAAAMVIIALAQTQESSFAVLLVNVTGFLLMGPYSYLAGATALQFGGKKTGATASGVIDGTGYFGAVLAGSGFARLVTSYDWMTGFYALAALAVATSLAGIFFWWSQFAEAKRYA